jgi:hypothetical protein
VGGGQGIERPLRGLGFQRKCEEVGGVYQMLRIWQPSRARFAGLVFKGSGVCRGRVPDAAHLATIMRPLRGLDYQRKWGDGEGVYQMLRIWQPSCARFAGLVFKGSGGWWGRVPDAAHLATIMRPLRGRRRRAGEVSADEECAGDERAGEEVR